MGKFHLIGLTKASLVLALLFILPDFRCGAFLNTNSVNLSHLSARNKAKQLYTRKDGKPLTRMISSLQRADDVKMDNLDPVLLSENFVRSREVHRMGAIIICSFVVIAWSNQILSSLFEGSGIFDSNVQMALLVVGYLVIGIPHGMLDLHLTPRVVPGDSQPSLLEWVIPYLGTMGITLGAWLVAPQIMFVLFLLNTIVHFGEGDVAVDIERGKGESSDGAVSSIMKYTEMYARGSYFGSAVVHQQDSLSANFQGVLGGGNWESAVSDMMPMMYVVGAVHYAALFITYAFHLSKVVGKLHSPGSGKDEPHLEIMLEMTVLSVLFVVVPAQVSIFLYLLIFHAPRHVLRSVRFSPELMLSSEKEQRLLRYGLITIVTMLAFVALDFGMGWANNLGQYAMPDSSDGLTSPEAYLVLRMVVVGTSVLTTPHSIVIFLLGLKEKENKAINVNTYCIEEDE